MRSSDASDVDDGAPPVPLQPRPLGMQSSASAAAAAALLAMAAAGGGRLRGHVSDVLSSQVRPNSCTHMGHVPIALPTRAYFIHAACPIPLPTYEPPLAGHHLSTPPHTAGVGAWHAASPTRACEAA